MSGALRILPFVCLLLAAGSFAACGDDSNGSDSELGAPRTSATEMIVVAPGDPVVIGVSVALTGASEPIGREFLHAAAAGVRLWKDKNGPRIGGHEITLRAEDDACTDAIAAEDAARRLVAVRGLAGVLGPDCSVAAEPAIPIFTDAGIVTISGSATRTDLTAIANDPPFFFRTAYRNDLQGTLIGLFASVGLQAGQVYLVDDGETYGMDLSEAARPLMAEAGIEIVAESTPVGSEDFSELAGRIASDNPDLVLFFGFNPSAALFYRQIRDAGYTGLFGAGDAAASQETFLGPLGTEAEGVLFSACAVGLSGDYAESFVDVHGSLPTGSAFPAQYMDAATILLDAIAAVAEEGADGSLTIDPTALREAVATIDLTDGASGDLAFDKNGDRVPHAGDDVESIVREATTLARLEVYVNFGLIPCQVQDGEFVSLLGPNARQVRLP